ncbi:MAG: hypothetical protein C4562_01805 [Actinobacteria bacterium]|nr:MAG: hypothetical protein C4562_01805 [Actinomycetota bacterium]
MKRLKLWQKYAIVFGLTHLVVSLILFTNFTTGEFNLSALFAIVFDLPLFIIGLVFFPSAFENPIFYQLYIPILGTTIYLLIGAVFGLLIQKRKNK